MRDSSLKTEQNKYETYIDGTTFNEFSIERSDPAAPSDTIVTLHQSSVPP